MKKLLVLALALILAVFSCLLVACDDETESSSTESERESQSQSDIQSSTESEKESESETEVESSTKDDTTESESELESSTETIMESESESEKESGSETESESSKKDDTTESESETENESSNDSEEPSVDDEDQNASEGLEFSLNSTTNTYTVSGIGTCTDTDIIIPSKYEGMPVTSIGEEAFRDCTSLTSITIPDSVTSIGEYAFLGCAKLVEVYNLSSLNITKGSEDNGYVGYYAKVVHTSLDEPSILETTSDGYGFAVISDSEIYLVDYIGNETELTLPENYNGNNYEIYQCAFYNRDDITKVTIPSSVTSIGDWAFYGCTALTSVTIPDGVTSIGYYAFYNCTSLTSVTIPDGVTSIGYYAFRNCTSLTSVTIPNSVETIGDWAFNSCTSLTEINFNATAMNDLSSNNRVFYNAGKNEDGIKVTIGKNVTKIPAYLFYPYSNNSSYSPKIRSVVFEEGSVCESIGRYAFYNCTSLTSVTIPDGVTSIGYYAFRNCTSLTSVTIPNSVTSIGSSAFEDCTSLTSVTIPNSVETIGDWAFYNCTSLTEINFNATAMNDLSSNNHVFSYAEKNGDGIKVTIGKNVTKIPAYLFYPYYDSSYSPKITSVVFEEGSVCESIGSSAFEDCASLTSITIPDSVTSIGGNAFSGCTSLTSVTIPDSVTSIGRCAFSGCASLTEINFNATAMNDLSYDNYVFSYAGKNGDGIKVTIGKNVTKIPAYLFCPYNSSYSPKIRSVVFEEGSVCESIGSYAFGYCTSLTSVTIPNSVTSIGGGAFYECTALTTINCEATSKPSGWASYWKDGCNATVVWGYKDE